MQTKELSLLQLEIPYFDNVTTFSISLLKDTEVIKYLDIFFNSKVPDIKTGAYKDLLKYLSNLLVVKQFIQLNDGETVEGIADSIVAIINKQLQLRELINFLKTKSELENSLKSGASDEILRSLLLKIDRVLIYLDEFGQDSLINIIRELRESFKINSQPVTRRNFLKTGGLFLAGIPFMDQLGLGSKRIPDSSTKESGDNLYHAEPHLLVRMERDGINLIADDNSQYSKKLNHLSQNFEDQYLPSPDVMEVYNTFYGPSKNASGQLAIYGTRLVKSIKDNPSKFNDLTEKEINILNLWKTYIYITKVKQGGYSFHDKDSLENALADTFNAHNYINDPYHIQPLSLDQIINLPLNNSILLSDDEFRILLNYWGYDGCVAMKSSEDIGRTGHLQIWDFISNKWLPPLKIITLDTASINTFNSLKRYKNSPVGFYQKGQRINMRWGVELSSELYDKANLPKDDYNLAGYCRFIDDTLSYIAVDFPEYEAEETKYTPSLEIKSFVSKLLNQLSKFDPKDFYNNLYFIPKSFKYKTENIINLDGGFLAYLLNLAGIDLFTGEQEGFIHKFLGGKNTSSEQIGFPTKMSVQAKFLEELVKMKLIKKTILSQNNHESVSNFPPAIYVKEKFIQGDKTQLPIEIGIFLTPEDFHTNPNDPNRFFSFTKGESFPEGIPEQYYFDNDSYVMNKNERIVIYHA